MDIETNDEVPVTCSHCGKLGVGKFCCHCGSRRMLHGESIAGEIQSKATTPVITLLSFLKTTWLVIVSPRPFYQSYTTASPPLSDLTFPLTDVWRRVSSKPQMVLGPFQSLAMAIGLVACIAFVNDWSWRVTGFSERVFGMTTAQAAENNERILKDFYESQYGQPLRIVESGHLTGLSLIDGPLGQIIGLLQYLYFPLVVSVFLFDRSIRRELLIHYYVYAVSTSLAVFFVCNLAGVMVFMLLQGISPDAAIGLSGLPILIGALARVYFVVILPIFVLPDILQVTRSRMIIATIVGTVVAMVANLIWIQLVLFSLGVLWV